MHKPVTCALFAFLLLSGCARRAPIDTSVNLSDARRGFTSKLMPSTAQRRPAPEPPAHIFRLVRYDSAVGPLAAYVSPDPNDGRKRPAIVWITGGDCNSIGDGCWTEGPPDNDQSASDYRKAGLVMLFPSLRGGNDNPGSKEGFLGEVDDVIAAAEYLAKQPYIDPARIYLGGHSSGATLALLVAECSDRFRAVFSFGPADEISNYAYDLLPFERVRGPEFDLRAPGRWLHSIRVPTFVFEGMDEGNIPALKRMARTSTNAKVQFLPVRGATHFSVLAPTNRLLAAKVVADTGPTCNLTVTEEEVNAAQDR